MSLPKIGLTGPILAFANAVQSTFDRQESVRLKVVNIKTDLPSASQWQGRQVIIRDIDGAGTPGIATALDGAWIDHTGASIA